MNTPSKDWASPAKAGIVYANDSQDDFGMLNFLQNHRINASISSAITGTLREMSSQPSR
jgi:hypothetical protein